MKVFLPRLLKGLQIGHYLVNVNQYRNAQALPITKRERTEFDRITGELSGMGKHPVNWEPGSYLVHKDINGIIEIVGMNQPESREFISSVLGRF